MPVWKLYFVLQLPVGHWAHRTARLPSYAAGHLAGSSAHNWNHRVPVWPRGNQISVRKSSPTSFCFTALLPGRLTDTAGINAVVNTIDEKVTSSLSFQNGRRRRPAIRTKEVDTLLRERHFNHLPGGAVRIRSDSFRIWQRGKFIDLINLRHL